MKELFKKKFRDISACFVLTCLCCARICSYDLVLKCDTYLKDRLVGNNSVDDKSGVVVYSVGSSANGTERTHAL